MKALGLKSVFFLHVWQETKTEKNAHLKKEEKKDRAKSKKIRPHPKRGGAEIFKEFFSLV